MGEKRSDAKVIVCPKQVMKLLNSGDKLCECGLRAIYALFEKIPELTPQTYRRGPESLAQLIMNWS
jgi:hypothetical protein